VSRLGLDIGGTKVALRAEAGERVAESVFHWRDTGSAADDLADLYAAVRAALSDWPEDVTAVGVAVPATCDADGIVRTWPNRPTWTGLDLSGALQRLFPTSRVAHADDGDLAALAEARAAGRENVLYIGVGTGVGGGIVAAGRLWPDRGSCEVGHLVVDLAGRRCTCGRRGCVQAAASGPAILRRAAELRGADVPHQDLTGAVAAGASWAVTALREAAHALAVAVVGICELAHPDVVVLGGGVTARTPELLSLVGAETRALSRPGVDLPPLRPALLGDLSSLRGALVLAELIDTGAELSAAAATP